MSASGKAASEELAPRREATGWLVALALALASPVVAGVLSTQLLAYRLGFEPRLGAPWLAPVVPPAVYALAGMAALMLSLWLGTLSRLRVLAIVPGILGALLAALALGPVYPPWAGVRWLGPALEDPASRAFGIEALVVGASVLLCGLVLAALPLKLRRSDVAGIAHGSARLATLSDLERAGMTGPTGVRLGAYRDRGRTRLLHDDSEDHVLLIMPTGAGKTTGHIIPTLLSSQDSAVVLDPKGELWRLTSGWRSDTGGQRCFYFAPTSADLQAAAWNPLDEVRRGSEQMLDLRVVAESFISTPAGSAHESHWIASAQRLFQLLALHLIESSGRPSMADVRALLNDPREALQGVFKRLMCFPHDPDTKRGFVHPATGEPSKTHPEVAMLARSFLSTPDRELGSIVSTLQRFLALWADPLVKRNTSYSSFSLSRLLDPDEKTTLYVALPYGDLEPLAPLLRILLGLLIRRMTEEGIDVAGESERPRHRTLFLLDEFAALGRLPILERMLGFFRGYGIRAVIVVQDLGQLVRSYSAQETISGNCQIHVAAATQSQRTRMHLSSLAGEATVRYRRHSRSGGRVALFHSRTSVSEAEARRALLTPGEVGTLGKDRLLILKTGMPPALAWKSPYYRDPEMLTKAGRPPPRLRHEVPAIPEDIVENDSDQAVLAGVLPGPTEEPTP